MEGLRAGISPAHEKPRRHPKGQQRGRNSEEARMLAWGAVLVKRRPFGPRVFSFSQGMYAKEG
jgi:hypothetical protein